MLHVLTARPEFGPPWPPRSHMTPLVLNRLERPQVEALIMQRAGGKTLPAEVVQHIVAKTDGVPLYVEELTKMLLASPLLREEEDQYVLTGPLRTVAIPDTLQDALMARLDQLNTAKEVAQLGAVLGREFPYELLAAIAPQDENTLQEGLAQLVAAELLYQRGRPPRARYLFKHALIQDAAYASLLKSTRQQVHQQVAQVLEARFPALVETQPELVAQHYTAAGCNEQAVVYWQRAGQQASERSANLEAISHVTTGIELLKTLPETPEHTQQALTLHIALGAALQVTKGQAAPEVEHAYTQARALCQQVGETPELVPVLFGLWRFYLVRPQLHTARELGETLLRLAQQADDPALAVVAHYALGITWLWLGALPAARQHLEEGIARYTPEQRRAPVFRIGQDLGVACQPMPRGPSGCWGTRSKPWPASTRPWRWRTSCRILLVWRMRGVGRPMSRSFAETCRLYTSTQRPPSRSRPRRAFHSGSLGNKLPWVGAGHAGPGRGGDGPGPPGDCRLAGHRGSAESSPTCAPCWRTSLITWATRQTASRRWLRPTPWWSNMRNAGGKRKSLASGASCSCGSRGHRRQRRKPGSSGLWTSPAARRPNRWSCGPL